MAWQEKLSEDIKEISLYEPSPVYLHGYVCGWGRAGRPSPSPWLASRC